MCNFLFIPSQCRAYALVRFRHQEHLGRVRVRKTSWSCLRIPVSVNTSTDEICSEVSFEILGGFTVPNVEMPSASQYDSQHLKHVM